MHYIGYVFGIAAVGLVSAQIEKSYLKADDEMSAEKVKSMGNWVCYGMFGWFCYKAGGEIITTLMNL